MTYCPVLRSMSKNIVNEKKNEGRIRRKSPVVVMQNIGNGRRFGRSDVVISQFLGRDDSGWRAAVSDSGAHGIIGWRDGRVANNPVVFKFVSGVHSGHHEHIPVMRCSDLVCENVSHEAAFHVVVD